MSKHDESQKPKQTLNKSMYSVCNQLDRKDETEELKELIPTKTFFADVFQFRCAACRQHQLTTNSG